MYEYLHVTKPEGWNYVDNYEDKKTGFYAEAYQNKKGEVVMVVKGTDASQLYKPSGVVDFGKDFVINGLQMEFNKIPNQVEPAYKFCKKLQQQYNKIILSGYSLGGSVVAILGNDLNLETITFEAYGVGEFIEPRYTENIINFGNENDPIFFLLIFI